MSSIQVDTMVDLLEELEEEKLGSTEPQRTAEQKWKQNMKGANDKKLMPLIDTWYMGTKIQARNANSSTILVASPNTRLSAGKRWSF